MSNCIFGLVRRLVQFACLKSKLEHERKIALGPILGVLIHCLTLPDYNRYSRFKMDMYGSILCLIEACTELTANENKLAIENYTKTGSTKTQQAGDANGHAKEELDGGQLYNALLRSQEETLEGVLNRRSAIVQTWTAIFNEHSIEFVKTCVSDIDYAPFSQKILAMTCLSELLSEGRRTNNEVLQQIRQLGAVRLILDSFSINVNLDFENKLHDNKSPLLFLRTFLVSVRIC